MYMILIHGEDTTTQQDNVLGFSIKILMADPNKITVTSHVCIKN